MRNRIAPWLALAVVVVAMGCEQTPESSARVTVPVALAEIGAPRAPAAEAPAAPIVLRDIEALPRDPADGVDRVAEGDRLLADGHAAEAVDAYRLALFTDGGPAVWTKLGSAYLALGEEARGLRCLDEALALDAGHAPARTALASHYLAKNDGVRAREAAEELVGMDPFDAGARQMLGRAFMQQRMWKEAIAAFTLVVQAEPDNIYAHNNLGYSALQIGELDRAREHLEQTLALEPQQGYMLNNLGIVYERLERVAEAHAAFSRAAELSPRSSQARLNRDRLQLALTAEERVTSAEALVALRDHHVDTPLPESDAVEQAIDAATGGSARLAPDARGQ